jgi:hypothetical protein
MKKQATTGKRVVKDLSVKADKAQEVGGGSGGDRPTETLSLNFTKVAY